MVPVKGLSKVVVDILQIILLYIYISQFSQACKSILYSSFGVDDSDTDSATDSGSGSDSDSEVK